MSTAKKKRAAKDIPIFEFNHDTGKYVPLPLPSSWLIKKSVSATKNCMSAGNGSDTLSERNIKRKCWALEPLVWTAADFEEPNRSKIRKTDNNSVRKELFNLPAKGSNICRPPIYNCKSSTRRSISTKRIKPKVFDPSGLSPLLDMEEVEEDMLNKKRCLKGFTFKTPSKPVVRFSKCTTTPGKQELKLETKNTPKMDAPMTPGSVSCSEFLENEKMCLTDESDKENCDQSPISSVCNLLESAAINSIKKRKRMPNNIREIVTNVENLLQENGIALEQYRTIHEKNIEKMRQIFETDRSNYETLLAQQNENKNKIAEILNSLKNGSTTKTENNKHVTPNRRSTRLLNKSPVQSENAKLIVSPVISRGGGDLRRSTLTKNLVTKSQQYEMQSPRIKKALDLYNFMRNEQTILATPKLDRKALCESPRSANRSRNLLDVKAPCESPKSTNSTRNLSKRLQSQCVLLQGTPLHK